MTTKKRTRKKVTDTVPVEELKDVKKEVNLAEEELVKEETKPDPTMIIEEAEVFKPTPIRWKKIGGGAFIMGNRFIKPGQTFMALVSDIPLAFRDVIIPVDALPEDDLRTQSGHSNYRLEEIENKKWNIVDKQDKVFNETPLDKNEAENILKVL